MPSSPPSIFTPPGASTPDAPGAVFTPVGGGGSPDAPAAVFTPVGAGGSPDAPAAVFTPVGAGGSPDAPAAVFTPVGAGGSPDAPPNVFVPLSVSDRSLVVTGMLDGEGDPLPDVLIPYDGIVFGKPSWIDSEAFHSCQWNDFTGRYELSVNDEAHRWYDDSGEGKEAALPQFATWVAYEGSGGEPTAAIQLSPPAAIFTPPGASAPAAPGAVFSPIIGGGSPAAPPRIFGIHTDAVLSEAGEEITTESGGDYVAEE